METESTAQQPTTQTTEQQSTQQTTSQTQSNKIELVPGQLWKIIHKQGDGPLPKKGQQIEALYRGTLQNGTEFDSNQDRDSPFKFNLGEGRVIKGWDEGFASMKKGQKATLICSPDYAYGKRGSPPRIPANATLHFEVELLDFHDKEKTKWDMTQQEKLVQVQKAKTQGNEAFKLCNYAQATRIYQKGIDLAEDEDGTEFQQILKVLRLNTAQSQLKSGDYSFAIRNCTKVLQKDTNNLKALYRRGLAHLKSQDFDKAQSDFQALLKVDPENVEAKKEIQNVKIAEKAFKEKQKKVFGNMFSKPSSKPAKQEQTPKVEQQEVQNTEPETAQEKSEQQKKND